MFGALSLILTDIQTRLLDEGTTLNVDFSNTSGALTLYYSLSLHPGFLRLLGMVRHFYFDPDSLMWIFFSIVLFYQEVSHQWMHSVVSQFFINNMLRFLSDLQLNTSGYVSVQLFWASARMWNTKQIMIRISLQYVELQYIQLTE